MKAIKENKVYSITEESKAYYLSQGYNITEDDGTMIERSPKSTVPYADYAKVVAELEKLKAEKGVQEDELSNMSVDDLKAYAETNKIDIGQATSQDGILKKIRAALKAKE
jgi:hypothetical protein